MTSPILFAGTEDLSFTVSGPSGVSIDTTAGHFRSGYSRYGMKVDGLTNGSNGNVSYIQTPMFTASTAFWVTARVYNGHGNGGLGGPGTGGFLWRLVDVNNIVRLYAQQSFGAVAPTLTFYKVNAAASSTSLGISTGTMNANPTIADKLDFFINYAVAGQILCYVNGLLIFSYSGDLTTDSNTSLTGLILGNYVDSGSSFETDYSVWSEVIISTRDTRPMSLVTDVAAANGNTDNFTSGLVSNINQNAFTTAAPDYSTTVGQVQEYTVTPAIPSGNFAIISIVHHSYAAIGTSGPANMSFAIRIAGTDYFSTPVSPAASGLFGTIVYHWDTNPNTNLAWRPTEIVATSSSFNFGYKSVI
jgi:hypothetical protein